jgi:hypothetical protein
MSTRRYFAPFYRTATAAFVALALSACAALGLADVPPAEVAFRALDGEAAAHESATYACAAYERAVVARAVKPDARVSGRCAALR